MDLGFLSVPLTMAAMAFGFAVVTDTQSVVIDKITLPAAVASATNGYTPEVVLKHLADEMHEIERQAQSRAEARKLQLSGHKSAVSVLADFMKVTPLMRVAQETAGLIPFKFTGDIIVSGGDLKMVLRGHGSHQKSRHIVVKAPPDQLDQLIRLTAYEAMRLIDPYIVAAYQFRKDFKSRDYTRTLEIIQSELGDSEKKLSTNRKWLYNLWGMVLYQQADRAGAIEKFQAALAIDPNFASPMLNWGVVLTRQGHNQEAIERFRAVISNRRTDASEATLAATNSEWGFALALLGQYEQAFAKFRQAVSIDPGFADVYSSWAEVLSALGRADEAATMTERSVKLAPTEVIYTENLVGPVQNLPATASVIN
ncbi:MAG: tetratricopeptide repeat protein [Rhodospirillaceae bacterium]